MTAEGIFHDAHEVYVVRDGVKSWIATFVTKRLAERFVRDERAFSRGVEYEVVPV